LYYRQGPLMQGDDLKSDPHDVEADATEPQPVRHRGPNEPNELSGVKALRVGDVTGADVFE